MAEGLSKHSLDLIGRTFLFENVDEFMVERIVSDSRCTLEQFPKGERIFDELHFRQCLGIVLNGAVRVDKTTGEDRYMTMSCLGAGECFGAAALFRDADRFATVLTARQRVDVLFIPEEVLRWAMIRDFTITENYIRYQAQRIAFLNKKITGLTAVSAERRLAISLLEQCGEDGSLTVSMTELSRRVNLGRASLYRAMETLEESGAVVRAGKTIEILNRPVLEKYTI